jgi:hypothetical protein
LAYLPPRFLVVSEPPMPSQSKKNGSSPRCEACGLVTSTIGKLPRIGLRPLLYVYKCDTCQQIMSVQPEQQDDGPAVVQLTF